VDTATRNKVKRYEVGLDAITAIIDEPGQMVNVYRDLRDLWEALRTDGNRVRPFKLHHYSGHGCGPLRIGTDGAATVVQATGPIAGVIAPILSSYTLRATRLDIQVTFELGECMPAVAELLYLRWEKERVDGLHKRANKLIQSTTGSTAYTGSRKGDRTIRVYDKSSDMGAERGRFWRYEVEFHADKAQAYWMGYHHAKDDKVWLEGALQSVFNGIGIELGLTPTNEGSAMAVPGNLRSVERYLHWFQTSVAPVVRDLTNKVPDGILLEALGFQGTLPMFDEERIENDGCE